MEGDKGESLRLGGGTARGTRRAFTAILLLNPPQMNIVSIEDTRELNLPHENWVPLLTRGGFGGKSATTGKPAGGIGMFDLLTGALRRRRLYMLIREVRGPEAVCVI